MRFFHVGVGKPPSEDENPIKIEYVFLKDNHKKIAYAREGESLLEVAHNNEIDLEGACA